MFKNKELMKSVRNKRILYILHHRNYENCGSLALKLVLEFFTQLLIFILCLCQYFLHYLVKYCSIFKILDNFQQPMERAVEKCQSLKSSVHYEPRNCKMKSVKSFAGHPVSKTTIKSTLIQQPQQETYQWV